MANYTALYQEQDFGEYVLVCILKADLEVPNAFILDYLEEIIGSGDLWEFMQVHYDNITLSDIPACIDSDGVPRDPA